MTKKTNEFLMEVHKALFIQETEIMDEQNDSITNTFIIQPYFLLKFLLWSLHWKNKINDQQKCSQFKKSIIEIA
jgi:hypothetical protein